MSIEFNPMFDGREPMSITLTQLLGEPIATWCIYDWRNHSSNNLWFDHSIGAWMTTPTHWHLNAYSASTMWNTRSMSTAFKQWCENSVLSAIINKYLEADGITIKPQYRTVDNGIEHDHNIVMSLHKWHNENEMVLTNQQFTMRLSNNGTDLQWHKPVTIIHTSITLTVEGDTKT
eukprot:4547791-Amphidinium_carterae.1